MQLKDSVFDYTLDQMKSDSAAILASRVLSWAYPNDIVSISIKDSTEALEYNLTDYNGVINIATSFREPLLVIINGIVNKTKGKVSTGEILGGYDYIQHIMEDEFEDLKDYGIKDCVILKEVNIFCHRLRTPYVVVMTEKPYYRIDNFEGKYTGKRGNQLYKLKLNADSTYEFSKKIFMKRLFPTKLATMETGVFQKEK